VIMIYFELFIPICNASMNI